MESPSVDTEPVVLLKVEARYPDIALRAGLECTVFVKAWLNREGVVKKAVVLKSDAEIFNTSALDAAMQWKFKAAMLHGQPVGAWISIPFRFRLINEKENPAAEVHR